jgi:hypothetical protein
MRNCLPYEIIMMKAKKSNFFIHKAPKLRYNNRRKWGKTLIMHKKGIQKSLSGLTNIFFTTNIRKVSVKSFMFLSLIPK